MLDLILHNSDIGFFSNHITIRASLAPRDALFFTQFLLKVKQRLTYSRPSAARARSKRPIGRLSSSLINMNKCSKVVSYFFNVI